MFPAMASRPNSLELVAAPAIAGKARSAAVRECRAGLQIQDGEDKKWLGH